MSPRIKSKDLKKYPRCLKAVQSKNYQRVCKFVNRGRCANVGECAHKEEKLDDPKEPIRRGVPNEPRMRRGHFAFLCLGDMTVFQPKASTDQDRVVKCPKCESAEDIVIYR